MVTAGVRHRKAAADAARRSEHALESEIGAAWDRCRDLVDPGLTCAPISLSPDDAKRAWDQSPLQSCDVDLVGQLELLAHQGSFLAVIADEKCRVLWTAGPEDLRRRGARVGLTVGAQWDELAIGTNAIGLAYETGAPASVFAGEHWCDALARCAGWAAPVVTPSGARLGVLGLYGTWERANPIAAPALALLARLAAEHLPDDLHPIAHARGIELRVLGATAVALDGEPLALSPRQVELLSILAIEEVATVEQFIDRVYGDHPISVSTVKAEISHLRHLLGGAIGSRPYRLTVPVWMDALEVRRRLLLGDLDGALRLYHGPLLQKSEAPFAADYRHVTDVLLRSTLLARGSAAQLLAFADMHRFDEAILERVVAITAADAPQHVEAIARLANARRA